jgi:two-component system response regulator LytT
MLTSKRERFKDAFKIGATRFVTKPIEKDELFEALDSAVASLVGCGTVTVKYNGEDCTVRQRDIYMVEAKRDYVKIYLKDKVCESNHSLKDFAENLDDRLFISVHRSYLVNMLYVSDIKNGYVELSGGKKVSVARRKSKEVHQKIIEFDVNYR